MKNTILEGKNVSKFFGSLKALQHVDFQIFQGEILGLIGPNGAGKTTFVNVITNVYPLEGEGWIKFKNITINGLPPFKTARLGIARTYQVIKPFLNMTVGENIAIGAIFGREDTIRSMNDVEKEVERQINFLNLGVTKNTPVESLNIISRKKMDLAKALAAHPDLLIIDEVMAGLNSKEIDQMMEMILKINTLGISILCIEHVMKAIMNISHRIMVFQNGEKIAEGSPKEIVNNNNVINAYLGSKYKRKERKHESQG